MNRMSISSFGSAVRVLAFIAAATSGICFRLSHRNTSQPYLVKQAADKEKCSRKPPHFLAEVYGQVASFLVSLIQKNQK